jgi:carboxylesterase type B
MLHGIIAMLTALGSALLVVNGQIPDVRDTSKGAVQGQLNETSLCREWRGVFFAADTGGENRWKAPIERESWAPAVVDATNFAAGCSQIHGNPDVPTNQSEDCLNLNVYAPAHCNAPGVCSLPVLIWFHGGTFTEGWNEGPFDLYDGCNLAANDGNVVVVTANYRLGAFGFLVTTEAKDEYNLKGNFGMYDQRAAMQWVHDNIVNFGGDPSMVTIFGQSAGSMSVGLHYVSPEMSSSGLFRRVIMESNYPGSNIHDLDQASKLGNDFCQDVGCFNASAHMCDVACMRSVDTRTAQDAWSTSSGAALPWIYANGTNTGDGATFVYYIYVPIPYEAYEIAVRGIWNKPAGTAEKILDYYAVLFPKESTPDGRVPLAQVVNDYLFRCGSEVYGREVALAGGKAFGYVYGHIYSGAFLFPEFGLPDICVDIACHCEEIPFVFNNTVPSLNATFTPDEVVLASQMVKWWTNFARTGDPNGDGSPKNLIQAPLWPAFDGVGRQAMHINTPSSFVESPGGGVPLCAGLWDAIGYDY